MSVEKSKVCNTAEELFQFLSSIPSGYREKMQITATTDEDVEDGDTYVNAYFIASSETNTGYDSGLQIVGHR